VGVVDDAARSGDAAGFVTELTGSGFNALAVSSVWVPGETAPDAAETAALEDVAAAADAADVRLFVIVYNAGSATTPVTAGAQSAFGAYAAAVAERLPSVHDLIVGNEPNQPAFWRPQFAADGSNASAPAFGPYLAAAYDALKAVDPAISVIGIGLSPRGNDRPDARNNISTSPVRFMRAPLAAPSFTRRSIQEWGNQWA